MFSALSFFFQALPVCSLKSHFLIWYFCDNRDLLYYGIITPATPFTQGKKTKQIKLNIFLQVSASCMFTSCLKTTLNLIFIFVNVLICSKK